MSYFLPFDWPFLRSIISRVTDWNIMNIWEYRLSFWYLRRIKRRITEKSNWSSCYSSLLISDYLALVGDVDWKTHPIARHMVWHRLNSNIDGLDVWKINRNRLNNLSNYNSFSRQRMTPRFKIIAILIDRDIISRLSYNLMWWRV